MDNALAEVMVATTAGGRVLKPASSYPGATREGSKDRDEGAIGYYNNGLTAGEEPGEVRPARNRNNSSSGNGSTVLNPRKGVEPAHS
ncbi:hypothetical protein PO909_027756 [Leuciscus waleckii]